MLFKCKLIFIFDFLLFLTLVCFCSAFASEDNNTKNTTNNNLCMYFSGTEIICDIEGISTDTDSSIEGKRQLLVINSEGSRVTYVFKDEKDILIKDKNAVLCVKMEGNTFKVKTK